MLSYPLSHTFLFDCRVGLERISIFVGGRGLPAFSFRDLSIYRKKSAFL